MKKLFIAFIFLAFVQITFADFAEGQIDTIRLKDKRLLTSLLKPGLKQYLVYGQNPKKARSLTLLFWTSDIKLENRNGEKVFAITQHLYGGDSTRYMSVYSLNKATDFAPLYHKESFIHETKAYNWYADKITGADSVAQNLQKDFSLNFKTPNFNWNLDMETFEMLPLAAGKTFAINFCDAGITQPAYTLYKVIGSEVLVTLDHQKIDCWKLYREYEYQGTPASQTFWISKKDHEYLKSEELFKGSYFYKIKMMGAAPDLLQRFVK